MKRNYIYNLVLSIFNIIFPILSFPYASRVLGPVGIGKFQFITSFAQYFIIISNLGIPTYGIREIAKHKGDRVQQSKIFSELIIISFLMSMTLTLVYLIIIYSSGFFKADHVLYLTAAISVFLGFTTIDWLYTGLEEFRMITIRSVIVKLLSLLLLYIFVKNENDVLIYLYIAIFSAVANNAYNLYTVRRKVKLIWKKLELFKHIRPLLLIFSLSLAVSIYTLLDVVLLGFLSDPKSVGLYSAAVKLSKIVLPIITSVGTVTMPKMSHLFVTEKYQEIHGLLTKSLHFILFLSIPSFLGLALLAPEFIMLFSGREFLEGVLSMRILSLLPVLIGLGYFWGVQILIPAGKDKEMVYSVLGGMAIAIISNFILVPTLKHVGASIANVLTEIAVTIFYIYFVKKHYSFSFKWRTAVNAVSASILFIPIVFFTRRLNVNASIHLCISVILCVSVYFVVQWLIFKDYLIYEFYNSLAAKLKLKTVVINYPK